MRASFLAALAAFAVAIPFLTQQVGAQQPGAGQAKGKGKGAPQTAKQIAAFDPTGTWVAIVTEDWKFRMVLPPKGSYGGVPMNAESRKFAEGWDPEKDQAAGQQCRAYGAAGLMRLPGRLNISWEDDNTLKIDADAGTQSRKFYFGASQAPAEPSWQGYSVAQWEVAPAGRGPRQGNMRVTTSRMLAGYLRKNGVPYSANAQLTEWYDSFTTPTGERWLVVATEVRDPQYLSQPFVTTTHFKREPDGSKFKPEPCSSR